MDPNNLFGFDYRGPDPPSSGTSPDYAPSPYIQQEQHEQQQQTDEQALHDQNTVQSSHTDPSNPLALALNPQGDRDEAIRIFNFHHPQQPHHLSDQQATIMSSHTDPNPADIRDDDAAELERLRNRFRNHENKLMIMETLNERDAVPGGRVGRRMEERRGAVDYGQEDPMAGEGDYGGDWEMRQEREFNREEFNDDNGRFERPGQPRVERSRMAGRGRRGEPEEEDAITTVAQLQQFFRRSPEGTRQIQDSPEIIRGIPGHPEHPQGLGFGQPQHGDRGFRPASRHPSLSQPQPQSQGLGFGAPARHTSPSLGSRQEGAHRHSIPWDQEEDIPTAGPPLSHSDRPRSGVPSYAQRAQLLDSHTSARQPSGLGFGSAESNPLELLGMGVGRGTLSNMVADSLPGGDGVTRKKRPGFPRQTETYYREAAGTGKQHPTQEERDHAEDDYDGLPHMSMHRPSRPQAGFNNNSRSGAGRRNDSLLDRASASLGLQSVSTGPVLGYAGPPLDQRIGNQQSNPSMEHVHRPFQPVGASQPANPMLNPFLNPQPLPPGFRPISTSLPDEQFVRPDGRAAGGAPRPSQVSAFPPTGSNTRPLFTFNRRGEMVSDDDDYENYEESEIDEDTVDGIPHHLALGHGRGRNVGNHRHFYTEFGPPPRPSMGENLPPSRPESAGLNSQGLPPGVTPRGAELPDGRVVGPGERPLTPGEGATPARYAPPPSIAEAGLGRGRARRAHGMEYDPDIMDSDGEYTPQYLAFGERGRRSAISGRGGRGTQRGRVAQPAPRQGVVGTVDPRNLNSHADSGPPQPQRRQPSFMQPTQASQRSASSGSDTNSAPGRNSIFSQRGRGATNVRGRGRAAPSPVTRQSPLPNSGHWDQRPQRPHRNPFAGRDMDGESSADEAPAPPRAANAANSRGRGTGSSAARGGNIRGGRGPGRSLISHNNGRRPSATPSMGMGNHAGSGARQVSTNTATNQMAGLGIGGIQGHDMRPLRRPPAQPAQPPPGPELGSLDGRPVFAVPNGGIAIAPPPQPENAPKPKPKGGANAMIEQLRQQAAAQMAAIQQQLNDAEEAVLAEEEAGQMDVDNEAPAKQEDDIGNVEDWSNGGVDDYEEDSEYEYAMKVAKGKKGQKGTAAGIMGAMKNAAAALGLEDSDELDEGDTTREANRAHDRRVLDDANVAYRENLEHEDEMQDDSDIDEYEADLMTEDEEDEDPGEAMAREAQRLLQERANQAQPAPAFDSNIDPALQMLDVPQQGAFYNVVPPPFRPEEGHSEGSGFDPNNPDTWPSDVDSDGLPRRSLQDEDGDVAMDDDEGTDQDDDEEYDSEWEEDPTGYDDAAALAALARPAGNIQDTYSALDAFGIQANPMALAGSLKRPFGHGDPDLLTPGSALTNWESPRKKMRIHGGRGVVPQKQFTLFEALGQYPEIVFELCKQMVPKDLLKMYCISKDFHEIVNGHMTHVVKSCARYYARESAGVYPHGIYQSLCIRDPVFRRDPRNWAVARWIPGLKWLQMVAHRERAVRDILASLARAGHRTPKSMSLSVKKIWLVMDIATTAQRISLCHNDWWFTDMDCYNAQFFIIKLLLMFNEPMSQHGDDGMMRIFLGQRGLTPLCKLLKREKYLEDFEILKLAIKYNYDVKEGHEDLQMFGIKPENIGKGHLEGWGKGKIHLFRIDEIVMRESTRRKLNLDDHLLYMMLWGHVNPITQENIEPSYEEMYMSDEEDKARKRQMDLDKIREEALKKGRELVRKDYRLQKKQIKKERRIKKHKKMLADEAIECGADPEIDWIAQEKKDEKLIKWFLAKVERQLNAESMPLDPGEKEPDAVDYFDIGDDDLPEDEVVDAYQDVPTDSDGESVSSDRMDRALVNLRPPTMIDSDTNSEYDIFDELREFDPTQEWESDDEDHPGESLISDIRDSGAIGGSGWTKNMKWAEDEPEPVEEDEFGDPVDDDGWWATTSEEEGEDGEEEDDDDDNN